MRTSTSVLLLLACALGAAAQQPVRYVVQLDGRPLLAARGERFAQQRIQREHDDFESRASAAGFQVIRRLTVAANVAIVEGDPGRDGTLRGMPGVRRAFKDRQIKQHFDAAIPLHQIDAAWSAIPGATYNASNPTAWNVAGQGVKIGFVDTGIDATHPAFQAPNMTAPAGFPKWSTNSTGNKALTGGKIIVARSYGVWSAQDVDGHGTAVASVAAGVPLAAGTAPAGMTLGGVAPAAWIGVYDVDTQHIGSYSDSDIITALDDCAADGMDVVSMSFGAPDYGGSLDPQNLLYREVFNTLRANGTVLVASAGNDGPGPYTMASPGVDPSVITAGAQQSHTVYANPGVVMADGTTVSAAAATNNTGITPDFTGQVVSVTQWDSTGQGCTSAGKWPQAGVAAGKILLIQRGNCYFAEKLLNAQASGALAVIVYNVATSANGDGGDYLINMDLSSLNQTTNLSATQVSAIANVPALFIGYNDGTRLLSNAQSTTPYSVTAKCGVGSGNTHILASFSSRGPDFDLNIKPDLVAAGESVVAGWCTDTSLDSYYNQCDRFGYQLVDGTSFSAPLTAGVVALVRSARPGLTSDDYRSLVVNNTTALLNDSGDYWPLADGGAGSLNAVLPLQSSVTANPVSLSFGATSSNFAASRQLTLKNVSGTTRTYNLSFESVSSSTVVGTPAALPSGSTVFMPLPSQLLGDYLGLSNQAPVLWTRSVTLAGGASTTLTVQAPQVRAKPGVYQGFIDVTPSGGTTPEARIPWWFAVTYPAPTTISLSANPLALTYGGGQLSGTVTVRFLDPNNVMLPAPSNVTVSTLTGYAVASTPYLASSAYTCQNPCTNVVFPNVWLIDVYAPYGAPSGSISTLRITSGNLTTDFTAVVQ